MADVQLSGPLALTEKFTYARWRDMHKEAGIVGDTDGSAFGLTLPSGSDIAELGSATIDSVALVGGFPVHVPAGTTQSLTIPAATAGGTTGRTDLIVARFDSATFNVAPGPSRLYRIPGTPGSLERPAYTANDLRLYAIRRKEGEGLNQAIVTDLRAWTADPILVAPPAPLPQNAALGTRATRAGITYLRDLVDGAPDWVQENYLPEILTGLATGTAVTGWQRQTSCRLVRLGKQRWLHLVVARGPGQSTITSDSRGAVGGAIGLASLLDADKPADNTPMVGRVLTVAGNPFPATAVAASTGTISLIGTAPDITLAWSDAQTKGAEIALDATWWVA